MSDECLMLGDHAIILRSILTEVEKLAAAKCTATAHLPLKPSSTSQSRVSPACTNVHNQSSNEARKVAEAIALQRHEALCDFLAKNSGIDVVRIIGDDHQHTSTCPSQPTSGVPEIVLTPLEFKRRYVWRNIPAIIRGLDQKHLGSFHNLAKLWRKHNPDGELPTLRKVANARRLRGHLVVGLAQDEQAVLGRSLHDRKIARQPE